MNRTRPRRDALKYLLLTTGLATLAFVAFVAFVFEARPPFPDLKPRARAPASDESSRPFVLNLPCWGKDEAALATPPPGTRWVRLTGKVCGRAVKADAVTVTNETNHYLATILPFEGQLTTDLIELAPGANDLQITIDHVVTHVALTR